MGPNSIKKNSYKRTLKRNRKKMIILSLSSLFLSKHHLQPSQCHFCLKPPLIAYLIIHYAQIIHIKWLISSIIINILKENYRSESNFIDLKVFICFTGNNGVAHQRITVVNISILHNRLTTSYFFLQIFSFPFLLMKKEEEINFKKQRDVWWGRKNTQSNNYYFKKVWENIKGKMFK